MKVHIDEHKCVASGQCVLVAPDVFDQRDEDGVAVLLDDSPTPDKAGQIQEAVVICPGAAIRLDRA
ncbi:MULTISPECIES: ferredoxin [Streptomyces]|uniref:Ferredoxin n=3 Tax=Streptomyces TaxID=1883 RepID=A0A101PYZ4_STRCK|nr:MULTISPECIES: ferredoxin [Streptomyces]ALO98873.1 ferredoxin [Streptomyces hygroscopicus subsp. limoneus]KUN20250.1 ferredoxin [Streptomyces corchorusii]GGZ20830.1 ferredoxin [Streptomyces olivaceoviridis]GHA75965.1 ferredoxin [Streptomyces canarius]